MKILNTSQKLENILTSLNSLNATDIIIKHAFFTCKINDCSIVANNMSYENEYEINFLFKSGLVLIKKCNIKTLKHTIINILKLK